MRIRLQRKLGSRSRHSDEGRLGVGGPLGHAEPAKAGSRADRELPHVYSEGRQSSGSQLTW